MHSRIQRHVISIIIHILSCVLLIHPNPHCCIRLPVMLVGTIILCIVICYNEQCVEVITLGNLISWEII